VCSSDLNPIAAAAALQTLEIYREENICKLAVELGEELRDALMPLSELPGVRDARFLGAIAAIELRDSDRNPPLPMLIRKRLFEQNILLRPLGNVIYLMPPLNTPLDLAREAAMTVRKTIEQVL
jgi:adenosylmethionine-8-amino-7-oxononanoate aminotransferase